MGDKVTFQITMNNLVKSGDQTINEIMQVLGANNPNKANVVRDADGILVRVDVRLPTAASEVARAAIDANSGVATTTPPMPDPLSIGATGLDPTDGISLATEFLGPSTFIEVWETDLLGVEVHPIVGRLLGDGESNTYQDGTGGGQALYTIIRFRIDFGSADDISIPPGELTIHPRYLDAIPILNSATISVPKEESYKDYFVDADGKLYLAYSEETGSREWALAVYYGSV
jgi:hypothetical protein